MRQRRGLMLVTGGLIALLLATGCASETAANREGAVPSAAPSQPYAGLETRPIRALDPKLVDDLLAGRGAGYALAAELNHYPGPTHVLKMATALSLSPDQESAVQDVLVRMQAAAQTLGRELVDLETILDQQFSDRSINPTRLAELTEEIGIVDGRLRSTHLVAHLEVAALLDREQIEKYDDLRGYSSDSESDSMDHDQHDTG